MRRKAMTSAKRVKRLRDVMSGVYVLDGKDRVTALALIEERKKLLAVAKAARHRGDGWNPADAELSEALQRYEKWLNSAAK